MKLFCKYGVADTQKKEGYDMSGTVLFSCKQVGGFLRNTPGQYKVSIVCEGGPGTSWEHEVETEEVAKSFLAVAQDVARRYDMSLVCESDIELECQK